MWETFSANVMTVLDTIDSYMYYPILIVVLTAGGLYFSIRTGFIQLRLFPESIRVVGEKSHGGGISSFQALMVSTASRVGTGNIVGVSTAICLGGAGALFWMWVLAILGGASAFVETTLAQIFKRKDENGACYGGPAFYIERCFKGRGLACFFAVALIATYAFGFNMLAAYNLQSTFAVYSFYNPSVTPLIIGAILAILVGYCLLGGGKRVVSVTQYLVPIMGIFYVVVAIIVLVINFKNLPAVFGAIFSDAFDFKSIGGGIAGSCLMYGIKRGLYSNEAGVGSAPNAAASADISHPAKQGLVQMLSVYLDTILLCTATGLMCLASGIAGTADNAGAQYVQESLRSVFGEAGPVFITVAMVLFAFTTLLGNLYYTPNALAYLNHNKMPGKSFMTGYYVICALVIFAGAGMSMAACWDIADITMGFMALINLPACVAYGKYAIAAGKDYIAQKNAGKNPVFLAKEIGLDDSTLDYWK